MAVELILGCCGVALVWVLAKGWRARRSLYRYDVRGKQRYEFPGALSSQVVLPLSNGIVQLPPIPSSCDGVFLELEVRATPFGFWFEPYIELRSGARRHRQPVERGSFGWRYVDVSELALGGDGSIHLVGRHIAIGRQSIAVHLLRHGLDMSCQKMLIVAPHPDDAEIAAFGLYADRDAHVVTVTAGESGEPGTFGRFGVRGAYRQKGLNRAWNSVTVPMLGGISIARTANLGYFDGTLGAMHAYPTMPVRSTNADARTLDAFGQARSPCLIPSRGGREATWTNLIADFVHVIEAIQPEIMVAPYPLLDAHPDHKMTTAALIEAVRKINWRKGSLLLYTNHLVWSDRYPFGRAGDMVSLPPKVENIYFDGIVSVPLDEERQARKFMALDAMVDLRQYPQASSISGVGIQFVKTLRAALTDNDVDYFGQAVRANELFFQVHISSLYEPGVIERILG